MKTSINISLDTRHSKSDGTYPLVLRLGHLQSTTTIPLNIHIHEKDWDKKNRMIRKTYKGTESATRLNNKNHKKKSDAWDIILQFQESGELAYMSLADLRKKIDGDELTAYSFFEFAENEIKDLRKAQRFGTARSYLNVLQVLKTYHEKPLLHFAALTYSYLMKFEIHHLSKGNNRNGLAVYMRTIRALFNKAIKKGVIEKTLYPFSEYKIKTMPTEKRALDVELFSKIIQCHIEQNEPGFHARNYFICSYMMYGMNFMDMAHLKISDIKDGRIQYRRRKTNKLFDIKISPQLKYILNYYIQNNRNSGYVFPILKRMELADQDKDIMWARKRYNKSLKKIAKICGIDTNLTSYDSRHSFATHAMLNDVPIHVISAMFGHSSLKTTEIYLKSLPNNILDSYNERVVGQMSS